MCQHLAAFQSNFRTSRNNDIIPHWSLNSHQPILTAFHRIFFKQKGTASLLHKYSSFKETKFKSRQLSTLINTITKARQRINKKHNRQRTTAAVGQHYTIVRIPPSRASLRWIFTFLLGATGEGISSLSTEVLTVSSATPGLGPGGPGGGWAHRACSRHLGGALGRCRVSPCWSWWSTWCRGWGWAEL